MCCMQDGLVWDQGTDELVGLGDEFDMAMAMDEKATDQPADIILANKALAFVAKSACAPWKYMVAYYTYR